MIIHTNVIYFIDINRSLFIFCIYCVLTVQIILKHPAVSSYLVGGADLMLPGVQIQTLPSFPKDALVSIVVPGNPCPVGVGLALMSSSAAVERAEESAGRGKVVEMLQVNHSEVIQEIEGKRARVCRVGSES